MATQAQNKTQNPISGFQFEIYTLPNSAGQDWIPQGQVGFTECDGLESVTESFTYKEGNDLYARQLPGRTMPGDLSLTRGVDLANYLSRWRASIDEATMLPFEATLATVIIVVYNRQGTPRAKRSAGVEAEVVAIWECEECWPKELKQSNPMTGSSEVSTEQLVLAHTGPARKIFPKPA